MRVIYAPEVLFTNESTKLVADIPEYQWIDLTRFDVLENQVNENFFSSQLLQVFAKFLRVWKSCCCCEELRNSSVLALCIQTFFSRGFSESLLIWKIRHGSLSSAISAATQCLKINQNGLIWIFNFFNFHQFLSCLLTLFDWTLQIFKISPNWPFLSTEYVNVARFARNLEWDFFMIFKQCVAVGKSEMQFYQDFSGFCEKVENGLLIVS